MSDTKTCTHTCTHTCTSSLPLHTLVPTYLHAHTHRDARTRGCKTPAPRVRRACRHSTHPGHWHARPHHPMAGLGQGAAHRCAGGGCRIQAGGHAGAPKTKNMRLARHCLCILVCRTCKGDEQRSTKQTHMSFNKADTHVVEQSRHTCLIHTH